MSGPSRPCRRSGAAADVPERLVALIQGEEARLLGHLQTVTRDLERRIAVRRRKHK
jgi:hypothetical protein